MRHFAQAALCVFVCGVLSTASFGQAVPQLWGVNQPDGVLFSIDAYTTLSGVTVYGELRWDDGGTIRKVGSDIEAFALDTAATAYMALNDSLAGLSAPVLLRYNVLGASMVTPNVVDVVARIGITVDYAGDSITGLSFDPVSGALYGLFNDVAAVETADQLVVVDPATGAVSAVGPMAGLGEVVESGQDLQFDGLGNLYVTDNRDDKLYRVDLTTADIVEVVDNREKDGITSGSISVDALAWDDLNDVMLAADASGQQFFHLTLMNGSNVVIGSLTGEGICEVEGMDFIPEPVALGMLAIGAVALLRRRRRA